MKRPDFGMIYSEHEGVTFSCRALAPGLSMHDLMAIFHEAEEELQPGDRYSGNPAKWPNSRGIRAVVDAILNAIYPATQ